MRWPGRVQTLLRVPGAGEALPPIREVPRPDRNPLVDAVAPRVPGHRVRALPCPRRRREVAHGELIGVVVKEDPCGVEPLPVPLLDDPNPNPSAPRRDVQQPR